MIMEIVVPVVAIAIMFLMYFIFKMRLVEVENNYKTKIRELESEISELKETVEFMDSIEQADGESITM